MTKEDDRQRWERYELRRPTETRARTDSDNDPGSDESAGPGPSAGRACTPSGGAGSSSDLPNGEVPADTHGYPMMKGLARRLLSVDVVEAFSPPRVTVEAKKYGLIPGEAWDLTEGWDFTLKSHREAAHRYQDEKQPMLLIGSPPCTPFSQLQTLNPNNEKSALKWTEGVEHMKFVISLSQTTQRRQDLST